MKLTNSRFYFDYNSTSPLLESVKRFLKVGSFDFLNGASTHQSGRFSNKVLNESRDFLYKSFSLNKNDYELIFHSGATEGINLIISGKAKYHFLKKESLNFFYFISDHPSVTNQVNYLKALGHKCIALSPNYNGDFEIDKIISTIKKEKGPSLLNYTWVHNLSGVVWGLDKALKIKEVTGIDIHVDAVQSIGKVEGFTNLEKSLDAYTYSGHKFGALKGVGFSFVKKSLDLDPLLYGGGQEGGIRSGTVNVLGAYSLKLALEEYIKRFDYNEVFSAKSFIERKLTENFKEIFIVSKDAKQRNTNTITCLFSNCQSELLVTAFDMAGIEVSRGSACSSKSTIASRTLLSMGISEEQAKASIRFSFSTFMNMEEAKVYYIEIKKVLTALNFISKSDS